MIRFHCVVIFAFPHKYGLRLKDKLRVHQFGILCLLSLTMIVFLIDPGSLY